MSGRETASLAGRTVIVTQARARSEALVGALSARGARVIEAPAVAIDEPPDWGPADAALGRLDSYDWIVFTSRNAVDSLFDRMRALGIPAARLTGSRAQRAAVGPTTAEALEAQGAGPPVVGRTWHAEGLLERLREEPLSGRKVLLPRALVARDVLPRGLEALGAHVDIAPVYRLRNTPEDLGEALEALAARRADAILFTSGETARAFLEGPGQPADRELFRGVCIVSIGPATSAALGELGLAPTIEAESASVPSLVEAVVNRLAREVPPPGDRREASA